MSRYNNNNSKVFISALRNLNALTCLLITKNKNGHGNNSQLTTTRLLQVVPFKNSASVTLCTVNGFLRFYGRVLLGPTFFGCFGWLVFFGLFYWEKVVFAMVDPLFQTTQNLVEMTENKGEHLLIF